jgi:transposase
VLDVVKELLAEDRDDEVVALVSQLLQRNAELEKQKSVFKTREGTPVEQLVMMLDGLVDGVELEEVNRRLREKSGIDELAARAKDVKPAKPQPPLRTAPPANLRRVENVIPVPDAERPCPQCGKVRDCIGHDVTEVVDLIPAEVIVRVDKREKVACGDCESQVQRAPVGDKVVPGGAIGTTLVANVLVDKYRMGLPLHRQKEQFERRGYDVAVSTLADQVTWGTDLLRPLWRAALAVVLKANIMHLDATGLSVLDRDTPKGIKLGSLWGYVGVDGQVATALYLYTSTGKKTGQRPGELGPEDVLKLREGFTVADAATLYNQSFKREGIIECGCNMHARRYLIKAAATRVQRYRSPPTRSSTTSRKRSARRMLRSGSTCAHRRASPYLTNSPTGAARISRTSRPRHRSVRPSATSSTTSSRFAVFSRTATSPSTTASSNVFTCVRRCLARITFSREATRAASAPLSRTRCSAAASSPRSTRSSTWPTSCRG